MLYNPKTQRAASVPPELSGRKFGRLLKKSTRTEDLALLALRLEQDGLRRFTRVQAARQVGISVSYISTAHRLSAEERIALAHGKLSLSSRHNRRRSDAELDRLVKRYGIEALWRALDRATAPASSNDSVAVNGMAAE